MEVLLTDICGALVLGSCLQLFGKHLTYESLTSSDIADVGLAR